MEFKDRVSAYPNRYLLTDENGNTSYVHLERADEPTVPGTPLDAETLNNLLQKEGGVMTGGIEMGGHRLSGLPTPAESDEAAPKSYVDALVSVAKKAVRVTTPGTHVDNYKDDGIYYFDSSVTPGGVPIGVNGWLVVMGADGLQNYKQVWLRMGTPNSNDHQIFVRTFGSNAWGNWVSITTNKLTSGIDYGTSLPTDGNFAGRLFFLKA